MQYRKFGKLDWKVSALGFGAMRLPVIDGDQSKIDESEAIKMIRYAADNGVNYIDTAYMYHQGQSEIVVGKALKDGYRQKMKLVTKLPVNFMEKPDDIDKILNEQLKKLDVDKIDFYLLHGLNKIGWGKVKEWKVLNWAEKQMADGKFGRLGFSFHDTTDVFKQIVDGYDNWVLSQVQYNYMDENEQAGREGVQYAASKGIALVIMEPLRGGKLSKDPMPAPVAKVIKEAKRQMPAVEWALDWLWNQPEISLTLSGMSTMEQVKQNVKLASDFKGPGSLTAEDLAVVKKMTEAYRSLSPIPCTACQYCQPCPSSVQIPNVFQIYNDAVMYDDVQHGKFIYNSAFGIPQDQRADKCTECGECLSKCPQEIDIPSWLKKAHEALYSDVPIGPPGPPPAKKKD
ncbi:MAG: aldo/keto reductase [Dehalococcoidales bacterium]|nr:aldo/keto reductase [Dehalococcoidales bacterium]